MSFSIQSYRPFSKEKRPKEKSRLVHRACDGSRPPSTKPGGKWRSLKAPCSAALLCLLKIIAQFVEVLKWFMKLYFFSKVVHDSLADWKESRNAFRLLFAFRLSFLLPAVLHFRSSPSLHLSLFRFSFSFLLCILSAFFFIRLFSLVKSALRTDRKLAEVNQACRSPLGTNFSSIHFFTGESLRSKMQTWHIKMEKNYPKCFHSDVSLLACICLVVIMNPCFIWCVFLDMIGDIATSDPRLNQLSDIIRNVRNKSASLFRYN